MKYSARWLAGLSGRLANFLALLAAVCVILLTVVISIGVLSRFVFNHALNWTDELASYCLLWIVFFGLAYTLKTDSHIRINVLTDRLPSNAKIIADRGAHAIGFMFASLLFYGCWKLVANFIKRGTRSTSGLDIPLYLPAIALLIGTAIFGLVMLSRAMHLVPRSDVQPTRSGSDVDPEGSDR